MTALRTRMLTQYGRSTLLISIAEGLLAAAFMGIEPLLIVLYVLRLGYGPEFVGILSASGALTFSLFSLVGAALGRRFGVRTMMIAGAATNVLGMSLIPFTEAVPATAQSWWLLLGRILSGAGWSMLMVNEVPALASYATAANRPRAYALRQSTSGLGALLGTLGGSILPSVFSQLLGRTTDDPAPYRYGLSTCILIGIVGLIPLTRLGRPERTKAEALSRSALETPPQSASRPALPALAGLMLCAFLSHAALASGKVFYSAYMDQGLGLATSLIGFITSAGMLLAIVGALSGARIAADRSSGGVMLLASLGLSCSLLLLASGHWLPASLGVIGIAALPAIWMPAYQTLQMEITPASGRMFVAGLCSMAMSLGFGTISLGGGYVVSAAGYPWLFVVGGSAALLSVALMWGLLRLRTFVTLD